MSLEYTASASIRRLKLKGWISSSGSLSDSDCLELLNDSMRSYLVPFLKKVRDEWFVTGLENAQSDSDGRIPLPNSIASTIRTIAWQSGGGVYVPLARVEPENQFYFLNRGAGQPYGFMLQGYHIQLLPNNVGSVPVRIQFMERPATMVLEEDAGRIGSHAGLVLTLTEVPLAWQSETPDTVDLISQESPFTAIATEVNVVSLVGNDLTLSGIDSADITDGDWVADVGCSPYPTVPIEFHPLLQRDVITELCVGLGDKRLDGARKKQELMEGDLRATMSPRAQGSMRPIVNRQGPGMRGWGGIGWGWR